MALNCNFYRTPRARAILASALLTCSIVALAQSSAPPKADSNTTSESEIKALITRLAELTVQGDWAAYAQHLAPDYVGTHYSAHVETKDEALARLRDPQRKIIVMELEPDQRIRLYGDTAVSSSEFTISVRESGHLVTHKIRFTDTLIKRDGQWYIVAEHAIALSK